MGNTSRMARLFIIVMALCGVAALSLGIFKAHPMHRLQFVTLLVIGILGSRLKVKLPGLTSNMSVNLPFLLLATLELSLFEALLIALASTLAQCLPARNGRPGRVQILFNLSTVAVAVTAAEFVAHYPLRLAGGLSATAGLALASATFILLQTGPVATIISLTEGVRIFDTWRSIVRLSFPYFVLSAGVTSIVQSVSQVWGWEISLLLMLTMYGVYRSYVGYFGQMTARTPAVALAKAAASH